MSFAQGYTRVMVCSAGWVSPLSSPATGLAVKFLALLWAFQSQG